MYSTALIGEKAPVSEEQTVVSPREDGPGGQEPDPGVFRNRVAGQPGKKKSKKLSELKKKEVLS